MRIRHVLVWLLCFPIGIPAVLHAQQNSSVPGPPEKREPLTGRRTPMGIQKMPKEAAKPEAPPEKIDKTLDRALGVSGGKQAIGAIVDSVSTGTLTRFDVAGNPVSAPVTLTRKGDGKVQRVVHQQGREMKLGSDGQTTWDTLDGFSVQVAGPSLTFLESQTVRSVKNLWDADAKGSTVRDLGVRKGVGRDEFRVVEVEDREGRKTSYFIDGATSRVVRMEFALGESANPFGGPPLRQIEAYQYSDFRSVRGVQTPFTVERYLNDRKVEEMRFATVQHNASVKDSTFKR